jgi:hypothetical protein
LFTIYICTIGVFSLISRLCYILWFFLKDIVCDQ